MIPVDLVIWGKHPIELALQSARVKVHEVKIEEKDFAQLSKQIFALAKKYRVQVRSCSKGEIERSTQTDKHQNIAARVTLQTFENLQEWADIQKAPKPWLGVALDEVQDPQNVGTLIRAATFLGAHFLLLTKDRSAPLTGVVAKASAGGLFTLPIIRSVNLSREMGEAAKLNFWRIGLDSSAEKSLYKIDVKTSDVMLILGNEGEGLRTLTRKNCDELARLDRAGEMESLNVAVAGAVGLYEVVRQRY